MNNIKEQLKNVLEDEKRFTNEAEQKILAKVGNKSTSFMAWKISFGFISIATICILLFVILPKASEEQLTASTLLETMFTDEKCQIIVEHYNVQQKNDAIIAYQLDEQPNIIVTKYFVKDNGKWQSKLSTTLNLSSELNWNNTSNLYTGIVSSQYVEKVFIDNQEAKMIEEEHYNYWYAFSEEAVAHVKYQYEDGNVERITKEFSLNNHVLPYVPTASVRELEGTEMMQYKSDNMDRGNHHYTKYPIVIDPAATEFERGEVVRYVNDDGFMVVSRIVGLPHERFAVQNGTVLIDGAPLHQELGYAKVRGALTIENYKSKISNMNNVNLEATQEVFSMNVDEVKLGESEYVVVPDNWGRGKIEKLHQNEILGKVLGYSPHSMTNEWTNSEIAIYKAFKENYDSNVLIDLEPVTIARLYMYTLLLDDKETQYHLLTTRPEFKGWSLDEHLSPSYTSAPADPEYIIELAKKINEGQFIATGPGQGYIHYGEGIDMIGFNLIQGENGAWQVAFMPMQ